jgi:hypothetical protein
LDVSAKGGFDVVGIEDHRAPCRPNQRQVSIEPELLENHKVWLEVLDRFVETIPKRGAVILVSAGMAPWMQVSSQRADLPEKSMPVGESRAWEEGLSLDDVSLRTATGFGEYPKHADWAQ